MRVAEILRRAPIDGLAEGPALAATVQTALAGGTLADDALISLAWLKYVKAIRAPVAGRRLWRSGADAEGADREGSAQRSGRRA